MKIKVKNKLVLVILSAVILVIPVGISTLQEQQAYAPRECPGCGEFKKLTREFEKAVIGAVGNPDTSTTIRVLAGEYSEEAEPLLLGGPDTLPRLLEQYQQEVLEVFQNPPDPDKQQQHDQINEFKELTRAFEKAVIAAIEDPEN
jgi:hypothetical protein